MNILVTGGAGYLGTELVAELAQKPEVKSIIIYDNLSRGNYNFFLWPGKFGGKVKFINGDVLDSRNLRKVLQGVDVVYHLAAKVTTPYANADLHFFEQVNHWGTAELVYAVEESHVSKFVFVSSTSVYGNSEEPVTENTATNPISYYGLSKLRAEEHIRRLFHKIPTTIFRTGNVYGYSPSIRFDSVINKFMFEAHFNNRISIHGAGSQTRPFIQVNRVVQRLAAVLDSNGTSAIHNLAERNLSISDIANALQQIYPQLEHLFVNPHAIPPSLNLEVTGNSTLPGFVEDLLEFKDRFAFLQD
jgi:UDP-glucose 4-epimerase